MTIAVTAYSSTVDQCGADPFTTATGTQVRDGVIAANFLPMGTKVRFPDQFGNKIFVVEDRMAARYWQRADIWMPTREAAKQWGVRHVRIEIL
jgi:3D (Asp-Asp-Asp) domain-containing protein